MSGARIERCGACHWGEYMSNNRPILLCRRKAPALGKSPDRMWPRVDADDYCGEFKPYVWPDESTPEEAA